MEIAYLIHLHLTAPQTDIMLYIYSNKRKIPQILQQSCNMKYSDSPLSVIQLNILMKQITCICRDISRLFHINTLKR